MRYSKYKEIAAKKDEIKTESLLPSEKAAQQHSYWNYLQLMDWKFLEEAHVDPLESGWILRKGFCHPVYMYIQNKLLHQLIYSSLYVASANVLQKVLAQRIVHVKKWTILCCSMWTLPQWQLPKQKFHKEFRGRYFWIKWQKKYFWHFEFAWYLKVHPCTFLKNRDL